MIRIEALYTEACNLYGDKFNVTYLEKSLAGKAEVIYTSFNETPRFVTEDVDMLYMGAMPEKEQEYVLDRLRPYTDRLREMIAAGKVMLFTGNAFEIFGSYIENEDGSRIPCLGFYEGWAKRRMMQRHNSLFLGSLTDDTGSQQQIVGFKSQFTHTYTDKTPEYCFKKIRGYGLNPQAEGEGVRIGNFFGTYLLGPILIMNPYFAKYLLRLAGADAPELIFEAEAVAAYEQRLSEFNDPARKVDL